MNACSLLSGPEFRNPYHPVKQETFWLFSDSLENYQKRGGHPLYGEKDVVYKFNSHGYRCPEFDDPADIRIVAIGCSFVLGHALPQPAIFHELFAEKLRAESKKSVVLWNLGSCGGSNDYITRTLYLALPKLKPHIVLVNFTRNGRREYVSVQNNSINYVPNYVPTDPVANDICQHFAALSSPYDDQMNFFRNYKAVEKLLADRCWMYSHPAPEEFQPIAAHLDLTRFAGDLKIIDRARDHGHPGIESHQRLADLYWKKFLELGSLPQISQVTSERPSSSPPPPDCPPSETSPAPSPPPDTPASPA